jgi:hypothetical protein
MQARTQQLLRSTLVAATLGTQMFEMWLRPIYLNSQAEERAVL